MLRTLKDFEKCAIGATDGDIGRVKDLYFDDDAWVVRYLMVDTGSWLSGRNVLISPISIHESDWPSHRLPARINRSQVENSPDIDTNQPVSRQHEVRYLGYYGFPTYWGGTGMWGGGMVPRAMYPGHAGLSDGADDREQAIQERTEADRVRHGNDDPHLRSCNAVIGYDIQATDGEVGHVEGFLIDDESWAVRYLIVNTSNWWLGHRVLIAPPWIGAVQWSDQTVTVALSRAAVKAAPHYDPSADLDRQREASLYSHYGHRPYWKPSAPPERGM